MYSEVNYALKGKYFAEVQNDMMSLLYSLWIKVLSPILCIPNLLIIESFYWVKTSDAMEQQSKTVLVFNNLKNGQSSSNNDNGAAVERAIWVKKVLPQKTISVILEQQHQE